MSTFIKWLSTFQVEKSDGIVCEHHAFFVLGDAGKLCFHEFQGMGPTGHYMGKVRGPHDSIFPFHLGFKRSQ